jgi:hypothetical protein
MTTDGPGVVLDCHRGEMSRKEIGSKAFEWGHLFHCQKEFGSASPQKDSLGSLISQSWRKKIKNKKGERL